MAFTQGVPSEWCGQPRANQETEGSGVSGGQAILLQLDRSHPESLAGQLRAALLDAIRLGRLPAGTRLPASRVLAQELGVSRGVVVDAYEQLAAEGFLATRTGSGTTVSAAAEVIREHLPQLDPSGESLSRLWRPRLDLRPAGPDPAIFPRSQIGQAMMEVLRHLPTGELTYSPPWGVPALRGQLAARLARIRGTVARADEIIVVTGGTQGLTLIARTLAAADHYIVAVEDPGDPVHRQLLHAHGLTPVSVPVDGEGLNVAALEQTACRALLASPSRQFPTGAVMSSARRALVIDWAVRRQAVIIEDDRYAELQPADSAFPCIQGMCPTQVVLIGSVSLTLSPALRLGWLLPPPDLLRPLAETKRNDDMGTGAFEQHVLASLLESGLYDRHLRNARRAYAARGSEFSRLLAESFPGWPQRGVRGGLETLLELPDEISELQLIANGRKLGLGLSGLGPMRVSSTGPHGLVLSYARLTPRQCAQAVAQLHEAVSSVRPNLQIVVTRYAEARGGGEPYVIQLTNADYHCRSGNPAGVIGEYHREITAEQRNLPRPVAWSGRASGSGRCCYRTSAARPGFPRPALVYPHGRCPGTGDTNQLQVSAIRELHRIKRRRFGQVKVGQRPVNQTGKVRVAY